MMNIYAMTALRNKYEGTMSVFQHQTVLFISRMRGPTKMTYSSIIYFGRLLATSMKISPFLSKVFFFFLKMFFTIIK